MRHYIGIDFHSQHSSVAVMDKEGSIMDERKLYHTDRKELIDYFSSFDKDTSVAIEATRNWYWLVDCLQDIGLNVKLVHAKKARIIAESTIKTDKLDARVLAHLDRSNFLPRAYIANKETRSNRELLRYYMSLVKIRSSIKNRIHAVLAKNNVYHGYSDLFGKAGILFLNALELPSVFRIELTGYLSVLEHLKERINDATGEIRAKCKENRYVKRLMTVPGIGYFSALLLASEIADINRFSTLRKFCSYAGLTSSTHQSADKTYHGHIIKDSNKYIRYALVEAVLKAIAKDPRLWVIYTNLKRRKGHNKARIAVAHKMCMYIYAMLKNDTDYRIDTKNKRYKLYQVTSKTKLGA
jgi:transposase